MFYLTDSVVNIILHVEKTLAKKLDVNDHEWKNAFLETDIIFRC